MGGKKKQKDNVKKRNKEQGEAECERERQRGENERNCSGIGISPIIATIVIVIIQYNECLLAKRGSAGELLIQSESSSIHFLFPSYSLTHTRSLLCQKTQ